MLCPTLRSEQNGASALDEEHTQIAISALRDAAGIVRSPVDICFGTRPSHAAKSRPLAKAAPLPIAATVALAMIGPMPGTELSTVHVGACQNLYLFGDVFDALIETAPIAA